MKDVKEEIDKEMEEKEADVTKTEENNYEKIQQCRDLSFMDGVFVTWEVFNRILEKRLTDEDGNWETDENGCDYFGISVVSVDPVLFIHFRN